MKRLLILLILAVAACKPEVYLGELDSPLGNWKSVDSRYYFNGENVFEDSLCLYTAISFFKDSLCCIQGVKGTFRWTYDSGKMIVDSTEWMVVELTGKQMALDYLGRIARPLIEPSVPEEQTDDGTGEGTDEGTEEGTDGDSTTEETLPAIEYRGRTIETDGSSYWYLSDSGQKTPCYPKEKKEEDGSVSVICWWDTRSDFYKPF